MPALSSTAPPDTVAPGAAPPDAAPPDAARASRPPRMAPPPAATPALCGEAFPALRGGRVATGWRCGVIALLTFAGALWAVEAHWRSEGFLPTVTDSPALWGYYRDAANRLEPDGVALVGSSRMQVGFHTGTFRKMFPGRGLVNVSMSGNMPGGVLEDLANDEDFCGTVICDLNAGHLYPQQFDAGRGLVAGADAAGPGGRLGARVAAAAQSRLACLQPNLGWPTLVRRYWKGRVPSHSYRRVLEDRARPTDYGSLPAKTLARVRRGRIKMTLGRTHVCRNFRGWRPHAKYVGELVRKIRDRGGDVAFVRFPTSGEHWASTAICYPREVFWDRVRRFTGARTLHFRDLPETRDLECPDTSHLDAADTPRFTGAILAELKRVHVL